MDVQKQKSLIAEKITKPHYLLWAMIIPQIVLILINISCWSLVKGDLSQEQAGIWFQIFTFEAILIAIGIILFLALHSLKRNIDIVVCAALFLVHVVYLWLLTSQLDKLVPETAEAWILPVGSLLYYQFCLIMPIVFYTGLRLACVRLPVSKTMDVTVSIALLLIIPVFCYIMLGVISDILYEMNIDETIFIGAVVCATVILMFAILRILMYIYTSVIKSKNGCIAVVILVAIVGPICGLMLNRAIPFPVDFQSVSVYILALINGIILQFKFKEDTKRYKITWCCKCLMYPFSLYFFLVFLPFMPLSLLAIIAMGSGFLILVPTVLFIIHTRVLFDEGRQLAGSIGLPTVFAIFILSFAVMPCFIVVKAYSDKTEIISAIDAAYNPDYAKGTTDINPDTVKRTLIKLKQMKEGIFLPFISPVYNKIVFNGMVLPDHKIEEIYKMFVGEEFSEELFDHDFGIAMRKRRGRNWSTTEMPQRDVEISNIKIDNLIDGQFMKTTVQLTLDNKGSNFSEFITDIELGKGVMVCGYRLRIGEQDVSGYVFEKKAAMWVYHMIRDITNRDPGLLVYKSDNLLKLSIFPFSLNEQRITAIDFIYPVAINPSIKIAGEKLNLGLPVSSSSDSALSVSDFLILPKKLLKNLPSIQRKPYLHFIVDSSVSAVGEFDSFDEIMVDIAGQNTDIERCKITLANFDYSDITDKAIEVEEIQEVMGSQNIELSRFKGGFCYEKAIVGKLLEYQKVSENDIDANFSVPIFVVIKSTGSHVVSVGDMSVFGKITPDVSRYYVAVNEDVLTGVDFANSQSRRYEKISLPLNVVVVKRGDSVVCTKNTGAGVVHFVDGTTNPEILQVDGETFTPLKDVVPINIDAMYAKGLVLWDNYYQTVLKPYTIDERLPELVKDSKESGILIPYTSYIVLENSAQFEMLKHKEKQGLKSNNALEFDEFMESPAPSVFILIPFAVAMLFLKKRTAG